MSEDVARWTAENRRPKPTEQVNSPSHYNQGDIECIDAMRQIATDAAFIGFCRLTAFKYLWRCGSKDAELQELEKAQWYLSKAIEVMKGTK